jgi:hypothetical protein
MPRIVIVIEWLGYSSDLIDASQIYRSLSSGPFEIHLRDAV